MKSGENGLIGKGDNNYGNNKPLIHNHTTMTQNEAIKTIAEYDGWELIGAPYYTPPYKCYGKNDKIIPYINPKGEVYPDALNHFDYHTNICSLWSVAKKVKEEMELLRTKAKGKISEMKNTEMQPYSQQYYILNNRVAKLDYEIHKLLIANGTFDVLVLHTAVAQGIEIINEYKTKQ
jgi:MoaA/NifB/PqqE/SkfB family radical SAM enzyme